MSAEYEQDGCKIFDLTRGATQSIGQFVDIHRFHDIDRVENEDDGENSIALIAFYCQDCQQMLIYDEWKRNSSEALRESEG